MASKTKSLLSTAKARHITRSARFLRNCYWQRQLILMILPGIALVFIFNYIPMYGAVIAFQRFDPVKGYFGSEWVGLKYFKDFFANPLSWRVIRNTFLLGFYSLVWGFPVPIILALLMDQLVFIKYKRVVQTISYFPHFISTVVVVGMIKQFFAIDGVVNSIIQMFGISPNAYLSDPAAFRSIFIGSGIWQGAGWGTIIYLAALSNVDPQLIEAAVTDGANRWQRVVNISIPAILPTTIILLIFSISGILGSDFQKVLLLYTPSNYSTSDIISTYVYRYGIQGGRVEFGSAIGLLLSVMSAILIVLANTVSRRVSEHSLW